MCEKCGLANRITDSVYLMAHDFRYLLFFYENHGPQDVFAVIYPERKIKALIQDIFEENPPRINMDFNAIEYFKGNYENPLKYESYMENYEEVVNGFKSAIEIMAKKQSLKYHSSKK